MSRIAKAPIVLPKGVEAQIADGVVSVKGSKGTLQLALNANVEVVNEDNTLTFNTKTSARDAMAHAGTARALVANMVKGVSTGFEQKLELVR
jgi:large subunit ribosomal protein L6